MRLTLQFPFQAEQLPDGVTAPDAQRLHFLRGGQHVPVHLAKLCGTALGVALCVQSCIAVAGDFFGFSSH